MKTQWLLGSFVLFVQLAFAYPFKFSDNAIVTTSAAISPITYQSGLPFDATGALVVTNTAGSSSINLQSIGACGLADGTTLFNSAATTAASTGQPIYLPAGCTVNHSGTLSLNGIKLIGDGLGSILNATDTASTDPHLGVGIQGAGTVIQGIEFQTSNTAVRSTQLYSSAIYIPSPVGTPLSNFAIRNNYFTSSFSGDSIEIDYAANFGVIAGNQITAGAKANPLIIQGGTPTGVANLTIANNTISGSSNDTCIELTDYAGLTTPALNYINVIGNNVSGCGAHGISLVGGAHINITGNSINNTAARGIYVGSESANSTSVAYDINIVGNSITGAGQSSPDYYIFVNGGRTSFPVTDVNIVANDIYVTTAAQAMQIGACDSCTSTNPQTARVSVRDNIIHGDGTHGLAGILLRGVTDAQLTGNSFSALQQGAVVAIAGNGGALQLEHNHLSNLNLATGTQYGFDLRNTGFSSVSVTGNTYTAGANALTSFLNCTSTGYEVQYWANPGSQVITGCKINGSPATLNGQLTSNVSGNGPNSGVVISAATPAITLQNTGAATNQKLWDIDSPSATQLMIRSFNDAGNSSTPVMTFVRDSTYNSTDIQVGFAGQTNTTEIKGSGLFGISGPTLLKSTTVSGLPTCNSGAKGYAEVVTDATTPAYAVALTGGGSSTVLAVCDGTNWAAH